MNRINHFSKRNNQFQWKIKNQDHAFLTPYQCIIVWIQINLNLIFQKIKKV